MNEDQKFLKFFENYSGAVSEAYAEDGVPPIMMGFGRFEEERLHVDLVGLTINPNDVNRLVFFARIFSAANLSEYFGVAMDTWVSHYDYKPGNSMPVPGKDVPFPSEDPNRKEGVLLMAYRHQQRPIASMNFWRVERDSAGKRLPLVSDKEFMSGRNNGGRALEWSSQVLDPEMPKPSKVDIARALLPRVGLLLGAELVAL